MDFLVVKMLSWLSRFARYLDNICSLFHGLAGPVGRGGKSV